MFSLLVSCEFVVFCKQKYKISNRRLLNMIAARTHFTLELLKQMIRAASSSALYNMKQSQQKHVIFVK